MRLRDFVVLVAVIIVIVVIWGVPTGPTSIHDRAKYIRRVIGVPYKEKVIITTTPTSTPKCDLSRNCPKDHFAFYIASGASHIVGPKICFEDQIIMSTAMNNVGHGLNIVLVNGANGTVEKADYLNMITGNSEDILAYLKAIKPGMIVLVASFDEVTTRMTDPMRDIFDKMGSTLIKLVKFRDNWVFAGGVGSAEKSPFEKRSVNDPKTNIYEEWPEVVAVGGCFPRRV